MIGIITIVCSNAIGSIFRIAIGIWIIYSSLIRLSLALKLRAQNINIWGYSFVLAIVMFACGLYIALNSGSIIVTIGVMMIVYSVIDIVENVIFMKNVKDIF